MCLLYPEGLIKLNPAAGEILKRCDGLRTTEQIIADLDATFPGQAAAYCPGYPGVPERCAKQRLVARHR
jgi:hypothetical protein